MGRLWKLSLEHIPQPVGKEPSEAGRPRPFSQAKSSWQGWQALGNQPCGHFRGRWPGFRKAFSQDRGPGWQLGASELYSWAGLPRALEGQLTG